MSKVGHAVTFKLNVSIPVEEIAQLAKDISSQSKDTYGEPDVNRDEEDISVAFFYTKSIAKKFAAEISRLYMVNDISYDTEDFDEG